MIWTIIAIAVLVTVLTGFKIIPPAYYGVVIQLGKRERIVSEGFNTIWPIIERVELESFEKQQLPIDDLSPLSLDGQELRLRGMVEYRPTTPEAKDEKATPKRPLLFHFLEIDRESLRIGLRSSVEAVVSQVVGSSNGDEFIKNKAALDLAINCLLRLETPPHLEHLNQDGSLPTNWLITCYGPGKRTDVLEKLAVEGGRGSHSEIEKRYGIDITAVSILEVNYSPDLLAAKQATMVKAGEAAGAQALTDRLAGMVAGIKAANPGISDERALLSAETALGLREKPKREEHENTYHFDGKIDGIPEGLRDVHFNVLGGGGGKNNPKGSKGGPKS